MISRTTDPWYVEIDDLSGNILPPYFIKDGASMVLLTIGQSVFECLATEVMSIFFPLYVDGEINWWLKNQTNF